MIANKHIEDPINIVSVLVQTRDIAKFWSALSEEERDFIHCVRHAVAGADRVEGLIEDKRLLVLDLIDMSFLTRNEIQ